MDEAALAKLARDLLPLYIDSAKSYAQLSAGALALTIVFKEKVLGDTGRMRLNVLLVLSWFSFLLAIGASTYYQWVAVRAIEHQAYAAVIGKEPAVYFPFTIDWLWPGYAYGAMVFFFFIGAIFLVLASAWQLLKPTSRTEAMW
jgi:hypothetical protein